MTTASSEQTEKLFDVGYAKAVELLRRCLTEHGYLATSTEQHNYRRIWGRDGGVIGLAALATGDEPLIAGCRRTLETLRRYQGPHGEIPSNVDPETDRVSYGGTTGRVDANLWFLICCGQYWRATGDEEFLQQSIEAVEKVRFLLGAWEFNTRGLLYVPPTGDWADEYLQSGYVLYDQLLYLQAQRELAAIHEHLHGSADQRLRDRISRLATVIKCNYWLTENGDVPDDAYHEVLYRKGRRAAPRGDRYWFPFFSPVGYGYRFDAFANSLAYLFGVGTDEQNQKVNDFIAANLIDDHCTILPAFYPVIRPCDDDWHDLQMTFSYAFKNKPYEYHNGGRWPMVTGFYAAALAQDGRMQQANKIVEGIHQGNQRMMNGRDWSFPEYIHGKTFEAGGTPRMGWSAAGAVIGQRAVEGIPIVRKDAPGGES